MGKPGAENLEPYRRLVELSKEMIELAHQCEQARRECEILREQVAREITASGRRPLRARLLQMAAGWFQRLKDSVSRLSEMVPAPSDFPLRKVALRILRLY